MLNILRLAIGRVYRRRQCSVFQLSNSSRSRNTATTIAIDRQHQAHSKPRPQPSYSDEMGDSMNENGAAASSSSTTPTAAAAATSNLPGLVKFLELVGNLKVMKIATNRDASMLMVMTFTVLASPASQLTCAWLAMLSPIYMSVKWLR